MFHPARAMLVAVFAGFAAACGGGGSSSPPPGQPNRPPVFTSASAVSVPENTAGTFYIATATDPDGDPLTFSVAGGADASQFVFNTSTRELRFATPPDFGNPTDANSDNVYVIRLGVSDGALSATLDLAVTVTDASGSVSVRRIATGMSAPIYAAGLPDGSGRVAIVERAGRIRVLNPATGQFEASDFLNITGQVNTNGEMGLLAIAFSPDFASNRRFFLHMNNTAGNTEIRSYETLAGNPAQADTSTLITHITIAQPPLRTNHKGGMLAFTNDGHLLIGMGDGGGGGDPDGLAQNPNTLLGKLLRIDPRSDAFPSDPSRHYAIPTGNAFPGGAGGLPEIWALGLRNPFRGSVDPVTGDVFIGDVGQNAIEEINRIVAGTPGPINFGWNLREGTQPYNGGANSSAFTPPVAEYTHGSSTTQGRSVTGGVVYRGPVASLQGHYLFVDFITNNVWSVPEASLVVGQTVPASQFTIRTQEFAPDAGTLTQIVAFGTDAAGNVYIVKLGGDVFRIEAQN